MSLVARVLIVGVSLVPLIYMAGASVWLILNKKYLNR